MFKESFSVSCLRDQPAPFEVGNKCRSHAPIMPEKRLQWRLRNELRALSRNPDELAFHLFTDRADMSDFRDDLTRIATAPQSWLATVGLRLNISD